MRILHVTIFPTIHGGIWTLVHPLVERLRRDGHSVDVLAGTPNQDGFQLVGGDRKWPCRELDAEVRRQIGGEASADPAIAFRERFRYSLELALREVDPAAYDLVHAHDVFATRALLRLLPPRVPLVVNPHGSLTEHMAHEVTAGRPELSPEEVARTPAMRHLERLQRMSGDGDLLLTSTRWLLNHLAVRPDAVVAQVPYGIDLAPFDEPEGGRTARDRLVILSLCRLVPMKGVHVLLDSLRELHRRRRDWECRIAGEGPARAELEERAQHYGLERRVRFLGPVPRIADVFRDCDLYVLPTLSDNAPLTVMEAAAARKPTVASRVGGIPEIVEHGRTGWLVAAGDADELCRALDALLSDFEQRRELGRRARRRVEEESTQEAFFMATREAYRRARERSVAAPRPAPPPWEIPDRALLELLAVPEGTG